MGTQGSRDSDQCVRFQLGGRTFGIPLAQIGEIAFVGRISRVPLAPPAIRGVTNWRGRVITLIDVATLTGRALPPARREEEKLALILGAPYEHLGLYVHAPVEIGTVEDRVSPRQSIAVGNAPAGSVEKPVSPSPSPGGRSVKLLSALDLVLQTEGVVRDGVRARS